MFTSNVILELFVSLEAFPAMALAGWNRAELLACVMHSVDLCLMSAENGEGRKALIFFAIQCRALVSLVMLVHHVRRTARTICRILRDLMFALSFMRLAFRIFQGAALRAIAGVRRIRT